MRDGRNREVGERRKHSRERKITKRREDRRSEGRVSITASKIGSIDFFAEPIAEEEEDHVEQGQSKQPELVISTGERVRGGEAGDSPEAGPGLQITEIHRVSVPIRDHNPRPST